MNKKHLFSLSLTLIIVMLFSALGPTTVYADDGAPPDTATVEAPQTDDEPVNEGETGVQTDETGEDQADDATAEEVATEPPIDEAATTEEVATKPPADEAVATEEATAEPPADEAVATEEATAEPPVDEAATTEETSLMEQLPDNTDIVVINAEGETEPLATEEAAAIIVLGDPMWCPTGSNPGDSGCSDPGENNANYDPTSLASLLSYLATWQPDANGTIWIADSYDSSINDSTSSGFTFDYGSNTNYNLTIQGGWDGTNGSTAITGTSSFDVPIVVGSEANPWLGSVTIRNILVSGVVGDTGLSVYSGGSVTVEDSEFTNNDVAGVYIDADENVTVRRSKVDDNGSNDWNVVDGKGLEIKSGGYVTLADITANDNQIFGADVQSVGGVAIANSTFNGNLMYTNGFAEFFGYGLTVVSQGDIALSGVEANENFLWGASLDGPNVYIEDSFFNRNVSDSTSFIDDTGLIIVTTGDVALSNTQANENRLIGANIKADGQVDIQDSSFDRNFGTTVDASGTDVYHGYGLNVAGNVNTSASMINLETVTADENYLYGANLFASGDVNIAGSSFSRNATPAEQADALGGLMVQSGGDVALDTVTVNDNGMFGAEIVADGFIDITDSTFSNNVNGSGLSVTSTSPGQMINLTNVIALGNGLDGAYLETNNGYVCISDGQFINNGRYGVQMVNSTYETYGAPVFEPNDQGNIFGTLGECPSVIINGGGGGNGTGGGTTGGGVSAGTYDDTDAAWVFSNGWANYSGAGPYGNSMHYSTTPGSYAEVTFTGTQITLYYVQYLDRGSIAVYIDDMTTPVYMINAYNASLVWQAKWTSPTYSSGTHTVRFVHVGASGTYVDMDAIQILP